MGKRRRRSQRKENDLHHLHLNRSLKGEPKMRKSSQSGLSLCHKERQHRPKVKKKADQKMNERKERRRRKRKGRKRHQKMIQAQKAMEDVRRKKNVPVAKIKKEMNRGKQKG